MDGVVNCVCSVKSKRHRRKTTYGKIQKNKTNIYYGFATLIQHLPLFQPLSLPEKIAVPARKLARPFCCIFSAWDSRRARDLLKMKRSLEIGKFCLILSSISACIGTW